MTIARMRLKVKGQANTVNCAKEEGSDAGAANAGNSHAGIDYWKGTALPCVT